MGKEIENTPLALPTMQTYGASTDFAKGVAQKTLAEYCKGGLRLKSACAFARVDTIEATVRRGDEVFASMEM